MQNQNAGVHLGEQRPRPGQQKKWQGNETELYDVLHRTAIVSHWRWFSLEFEN